MPSVGFVIGNGTSRAGFDLERLRGFGVTIGCNQLYKDFSPDYMVGIDSHMVIELRGVANPPWHFVTREVHKNTLFVTCDGVPKQPVHAVNRGYLNNGGLLAACYLAYIICCDVIYLIGIDFFVPVYNDDNQVIPNNVYGYNVRQGNNIELVWGILRNGNPDTRFIRVGPRHERDKKFWDKLESKGYEFLDSFDEMPIGQGDTTK